GISSVMGELDDSCYIGNIYSAPVDLNTAVPVLVDQDGKLGTQGFDGNKVGLSRLPGVHPQAIFNETQKNDHRIDEQQTRITALESKVATQQAKTEQQQQQMELLIVQFKEQAVQIQKLTAEIKLNQGGTRNVVEK
ncbi:MAG TPA: hypothetical protein VL136_04175, partial [Candidatus Babeliales bacterium]|nr:hypothetical protein [Candidatus Babeliales bacterium]